MNALVEWVIQWLTHKDIQLIPEWINGFELLIEGGFADSWNQPLIVKRNRQFYLNVNE